MREEDDDEEAEVRAEERAEAMDENEEVAAAEWETAAMAVRM